MTCYASLCFWLWTFILTLLALNHQSITVRFAQCPLLIFKQTKTWYLWNQKEPITIWSRQIDITTNFTCLKNHTLKLPPKRTTHETEFSLNQKSTDLGFHVLIFSILHNAGVNGQRVALSRWMTCYVRPPNPNFSRTQLYWGLANW